MTGSPAYLSRNQFGFHFRMRVPNDLRNCFGKKELKSSLRTGYFPEARSQAMILGEAYSRINITSSRHSLNGYQKGKCFYCFREIVIDDSDPDRFRETLIKQTGKSESLRAQYLQQMDNRAIDLLIHRWSPSEEHDTDF